MYHCEYFADYEILPKENYTTLVQNKFAIFDDRTLKMIDFIRKHIGPAIINTWNMSRYIELMGYIQYAGYRPMDCEEGAAFSQHKFGRAFDIKFPHLNSLSREAKVREYDSIRGWLAMNKNNYPELREALRGLEYGITWLHVDTRNSDRIIKITP